MLRLVPYRQDVREYCSVQKWQVKVFNPLATATCDDGSEAGGGEVLMNKNIVDGVRKGETCVANRKLICMDQIQDRQQASISNCANDFGEKLTCNFKKSLSCQRDDESYRALKFRPRARSNRNTCVRTYPLRYAIIGRVEARAPHPPVEGTPVKSSTKG